jgi:HEAT repeat protein
MAWAPAVLITAHLLGCSSSGPLEKLIDDLDDPARRERAIHSLLKSLEAANEKERPRLETRVVDALCEAYREDRNRPEIVEALAHLRAPRAKHVFIAALKDARRGGDYHAAALRAAKAIGELGLRGEVPALISALEEARAAPREQRSAWLERALVTALGRLGDPRAVAPLIQILQADPRSNDFYLSRLAAEALGRLGDPRAVRPLVTSLTTSLHGLLLFESSRHALCQIGAGAVEELLRAASHPRGRGAPLAIAASRVLGDVAEEHHAARVGELLRPGAPHHFTIAVAHTLLRLGRDEPLEHLANILRDADSPLSARRDAAELIGWYGRPSLLEGQLTASCSVGGDAAMDVLCWSVALAYTRLGGAGELARYDALLAKLAGDNLAHNLESYRPRLELMVACRGPDLRCLVDQLGSEDWRKRERAALEVGRRARGLDRGAASRLLADLAAVFPGSHPQVKEAILVNLERSEVSPPSAAKVAGLIAHAETDEHVAPPALKTRASCAARRLREKSGENR